MLVENGLLRLSATDLVGHVNCRYLTSRDLAVARGELEKPAVWDPVLEVLALQAPPNLAYQLGLGSFAYVGCTKQVNAPPSGRRLFENACIVRGLRHNEHENIPSARWL